MTRRWFGLMLLVLAVVVSALGTVYAKYRARTLFVELQTLKAQRDGLNVEWGRLQLEQSTWATHGRIDRLARQRLHMRVPPADSIILVQPE